MSLMRARGLALSLMLIFVTAAIAAQKLPRPSALQARPNVIFITVDTLRADHLGCYGAAMAKTPTTDALARDGLLFEHASSQVPLTWPSHAAMLTGMYPFQNGVQDFTGQPLSPQLRSIAQAFKAAGYATGAVVSSFVLDRSWGLARGFDFYDDAFSAKTFQERDIGLVDRRAAASVSHAITWLDKTHARPFFLWLHLYDPHSPYDPPEPYRTEYKNHPYDGEIAYADHELGRLLGWLRTNKIYDSSLIVFASDHGESLGDHGENEHGFFLYDSTTRVPLILKPPAASGIRPGRVARPVETVAIAPTLLKLAGVKDALETQFVAAALVGSKTASMASERSYSETFYPFSSFGWSPLHSIEIGHYRYIDAPKPELYDETADPAEANNIIAQQAATAAVLKEKLQTLLREHPFQSSSEATPGMTPETQDKLRALGYVAYRSPVSADALKTGLADPKDKINEFNDILKAQDAFRADDFRTGEQLLASVEQRDPNMYLIPFMRGESAARRKDWETSAREFKKCLQRNPNFDQAMTGLAHALFSLGDLQGAEQAVQKAVAINPDNWRAWYELGSMKLRSDAPGALADYQKAEAIQANFGPLQRDMGMLYFQQHDYANAAKHLAKACELGVNDARLFNFLGISYDNSGRSAQAVQAYLQALALDKNLAEAHLNLAYTYQKLHRPADAKREYGVACRLQQRFCAVDSKSAN